MTLRVIYRATAAANRKARPGWYSKWVCLGSLFQAAEGVGSEDVQFEFLCDGELPAEVLSTMSSRGAVIRLNRLGNSLSYLRAVATATRPDLDSRDAVYLSEDDYLLLPEALQRLMAALDERHDHSYFTLYDHPDRYTATDDLHPGGAAIELMGGHHWRRVESTNMSYATRVGTLRRDRPVHWLSARWFSYPHDRTLWRTLQGLGARRPLRLATGRRQLFGPVPSLATHSEDGVLAPTIDWENRAEDTRAWMAARELPIEVGW